MSSRIINEFLYRCYKIVESEEETTGLKKLNVWIMKREDYLRDNTKQEKAVKKESKTVRKK